MNSREPIFIHFVHDIRRTSRKRRFLTRRNEMDAESALHTIAQIAVSLAGFAGFAGIAGALR